MQICTWERDGEGPICLFARALSCSLSLPSDITLPKKRVGMRAKFHVEEEEKDDGEEDRPMTGDCCCQTNRDGECIWEKGYTLNPSISVCSVFSPPNRPDEYKQGLHIHAEQLYNTPVTQFKWREQNQTRGKLAEESYQKNIQNAVILDDVSKRLIWIPKCHAEGLLISSLKDKPA